MSHGFQVWMQKGRHWYSIFVCSSAARTQKIMIQVPLALVRSLSSAPTCFPARPRGCVRVCRYCRWRKNITNARDGTATTGCCCFVAAIVDFLMEAKGKCVFFVAPHLKYTDSQPALCSFVLLRSSASCILRRHTSGTADFGAYSDDDTNFVNYTLPIRMHTEPMISSKWLSKII